MFYFGAELDYSDCLIAGKSSRFRRVVQSAARIMMKDLVEIGVKGRHDFVTSADKAIEENIRWSLEVMSEGIPLYAEESAVGQLPDTCWILDPVDGTTNLIHNRMCSVVSLAFMQDREVVYGIVVDPFLNEIFEGYKNEGAYKNDVRLHVSSCEKIDDAILGIGDIVRTEQHGHADQYAFEIGMTMEARGIRRSGSSVKEMLDVACGRSDGYFEHGVRVWDCAAAGLIVREAGGTFCFMDGSPWEPTDGWQEVVAAATPELAEDIIENICSPYMMDDIC